MTDLKNFKRTIMELIGMERRAVSNVNMKIKEVSS